MKRKLTNRQVRTILGSKAKSDVLAGRYGVSLAAINFVRSGYTYADVAPHLPRLPRSRLTLTPKQVTNILRDPRPRRLIAHDIGCGESLISLIQTGDAYADVSPEIPRRAPLKQTLADATVTAILRDTRSNAEIAAHFGKHERTIRSIRTGRHYANVAPELPRLVPRRYKHLTDAQVKEIIRDRRTLTEIARQYGISQSHVSGIQIGKLYTHVAPQMQRREPLPGGYTLQRWHRRKPK